MRGGPILLVSDGHVKRHHIPRWMTAPEASQRAMGEVPRLSLAALADHPHELGFSEEEVTEDDLGASGDGRASTDC